MLHQFAYVRAPRPERRQLNRNHADAIKQIIAKSAVFDHLRQVAICSGDYTHVNRNLFDAADAANAAFLKNAQQLHLHGRRRFADFIQKDRAAFGGFKQALAV